VVSDGGIEAVAEATGVHPDTVAKGRPEVDSGEEPGERVRGPGAGRKGAAEREPGLEEALFALVRPATRGDPESPLVWTSASTVNLARALTEAGHPVSATTVGEILKGAGYGLQASAKTIEGRQHPDRVNIQPSRFGDVMLALCAWSRARAGGVRRGRVPAASRGCRS